MAIQSSAVPVASCTSLVRKKQWSMQVSLTSVLVHAVAHAPAA